MLCTNPARSQIIKFENEFAIWRGNTPGSVTENFPSENYKEEWTYDERHLVKGITDPTIRVFPPKGESRRTALIVCPGGGYNILEIEQEGYDVAEYFSQQGITAIVQLADTYQLTRELTL